MVGQNGDAAAGASFRQDIRTALKAGAAGARLAGLEAQLSRVLSRAGPATVAAQGVVAAGTTQQPLSEAPPEADGRLAETLPAGAVELLELAKQSPEPLLRVPDDERRRRLVHEEASASELRRAVAETRKNLHKFDVTVTQLTRQLRERRKEFGVVQQSRCSAETNIVRMMASREGELSPRSVEEGRKLEQEEQRLTELLVDARARATRWHAQAKHHDGIVQQERDAQKGGSAHRILARHPAGEVFLIAADNDSDDGYDGLPPPRGTPAGGRRQQDSSDDEDYASTAAPSQAAVHRVAGGSDSSDQDDRTPLQPPPAAKKFHNTRSDQDDDEYDSDASGSASNLPSPSGGSGSMSGMLERSEDASASASLNTSGPRPGGATSGTQVKGKMAVSDSESSDEEPTQQQQQKDASASTSLSTSRVAPGGANCGMQGGLSAKDLDGSSSEGEELAEPPKTVQAGAVPPLRQVPKNVPQEDEAEEVSSEGIAEIDESMETSRSL